MKILICLLALTNIVLSVTSEEKFEDAQNKLSQENNPVFKSYEDNGIAYRNDSDDRSFIDIGLSLQFSLYEHYYSPFQKFFERNIINRESYKIIDYDNAYKFALKFAFNNRTGFYHPNRPSSPAFGKQFNPILVFRVTKKHYEIYNWYAEFGFAHESNGMGIETPEQFEQQVQYYLNNPSEKRALNREDAENLSIDLVNRGWDYAPLNFVYNRKVGKNTLRIWNKNKLFIKHTFLQGEESNYYDWEPDSISSNVRRAWFQGMNFGLTYVVNFSNYNNRVANFLTQGQILWGLINFYIPTMELSFEYTTGIYNPFNKHSVRAEFALGVGSFIDFYAQYQTGYINDIVRFANHANSIAFGLKVNSFRDIFKRVESK